MALEVIKIFLLFYMCHPAMGLTHCYKTSVFLHLCQFTECSFSCQTVCCK